MTITTITVSSMTKLPHPDADFASTSEMVTLTAVLADGDNAALCVKKLQAQADGLVDAFLTTKTARMRLQSASAKPKQATERAAEKLANKHEAF
jgi:hypothetical protein